MNWNEFFEAFKLFAFLVGISPLLFIVAYCIGIIITLGGKHE